jgi:hypothetical protein
VKIKGIRSSHAIDTKGRTQKAGYLLIIVSSPLLSCVLVRCCCWIFLRRMGSFPDAGDANANTERKDEGLREVGEHPNTVPTEWQKIRGVRDFWTISCTARLFRNRGTIR